MSRLTAGKEKVKRVLLRPIFQQYTVTCEKFHSSVPQIKVLQQTENGQ